MSLPFEVRELRADLPFGARISGLKRDTLGDPEVRSHINLIFEDRGLIVFENVEPTSRMHVALSNVFGALKDHPVPTVGRVDQDQMPGVIDMTHNPSDSTLVELDGKVLDHWLPWHFDHCYNNELNRAGVLRAIDISAEGGLTGFADGIQLYQSFSPELRAMAETLDIVYRLNVAYGEWRFGRPKGFRAVHDSKSSVEMNAYARTLSRAVHPAVWIRASGEKVMHVSPWMAEGIESHMDAEGDELLEA